MFTTFSDPNADLMKTLAKSVASSKPTTRFAAAGGDLSKAGPIAGQFFAQPEVNVQHLDTETLLSTMPGGQSHLVSRFKQALKDQYPGEPKMWDIASPIDSAAGGFPEAFRERQQPRPGWKAQDGGLAKRALEILERNTAAKKLQAELSGDGGLAAALANAIRLQANW